MNLIKPSLLKQGDTIGILAPSGGIEDDAALKRGVEFFEDKGFKIKLSENIHKSNKYMAGLDEDRVDAIHKMFLDKSVNAIIALRGGYGALRIFDRINYDIIRNNPKIFCGYSDITILNAMFLKRAGLVSYSGPMIMSDFGCENLCDYTIEKFFDAVCNDKFDYKGTFWGGNLSSLVSLCGTDFIPDFEFDFFVEDINEPVYKIDRMLTQLANIPEFRKNIKSFYAGEFVGTDNKEWLDELLAEYTQKLNIPLIKEFPASHSDKKATIPFCLY